MQRLPVPNGKAPEFVWEFAADKAGILRRCWRPEWVVRWAERREVLSWRRLVTTSKEEAELSTGSSWTTMIVLMLLWPAMTFRSPVFSFGRKLLRRFGKKRQPPQRPPWLELWPSAVLEVSGSFLRSGDSSIRRRDRLRRSFSGAWLDGRSRLGRRTGPKAAVGGDVPLKNILFFKEIVTTKEWIFKLFKNYICKGYMGRGKSYQLWMSC